MSPVIILAIPLSIYFENVVVVFKHHDSVEFLVNRRHST